MQRRIHQPDTDVTFTGNSASMYGGGMSSYNYGHVSECARLTNVTFNGNSAVQGGGMDNTYSSPTLTNVTFSGSTAVRWRDVNNAAATRG